VPIFHHVREARATCRGPCPLGIPLRRRHRGDWHRARLQGPPVLPAGCAGRDNGDGRHEDSPSSAWRPASRCGGSGVRSPGGYWATCCWTSTTGTALRPVGFDFGGRSCSSKHRICRWQISCPARSTARTQEARTVARLVSHRKVTRVSHW